MIPLVFYNAASSAAEKLSIPQALGISGAGFAIVFGVLVVLILFITIISLVLGGNKKKEKAPVPNVVQTSADKQAAATPVCTSVPAGSMFVTMGGVKHIVTVTEKLPRFTIKINDKIHSVDVDEVKENTKG